MSLRAKTHFLIGGVALAAVLAPATAAYAGATTVDDESSDVWEVVYNPDTDAEEYVAAGSVDNVDVTSLRLRHLANRIIATATYAELNKQDVILGVTSSFRFDDGPAVGVSLDTYSGWSGETVIYKRRGGPIECGGLQHAIDYAANTVELSIPRKCVGEPRWVEAGWIGNGSVEDADAEYGWRNYRDNALNAGHTQNGWSERVRKG